MPQLLIDGERKKDQDVRTQNATACIALANIVKSSLGPNGLDKMLVDQIGDVTISNDGATILKKLEVEHPAAKVLVQLADLQDQEVGDGTTSVVIIAAELLKRANDLVKHDIHPTSIISGFRVAMRESVNYINEYLSIKVDSLGKNTLINCARTSMSSKIIVSESDFFADMCVRAVLRVKSTDASGASKYPISNISILKAPGKSAKDSMLVEGFALNCTIAAESMPKKIKNAKIALLDFNLNKGKMPQGVKLQLSDAKAIDEIHKKETDMLRDQLKLIIDAGANVIFTVRGIDDLAVKILSQHGVAGVRRCRKADLKKIAKATGGQLILNLVNEEGGQSFDASALGTADLVEQIRVADEELIVIKGTKNSKSASIILRGANSYMLEEMERSVHDVLCAIQRTVESGYIVPGGGAVETSLAMYLENFARTMGSREQLAIVEFAQALLTIPKTLAVNSALDATDLVAKLCTLHTAAQKIPEKKNYARYGLDLDSGKPRDNVEAGVIEPAIGKVKCIKFATEAAITILRIDDLIQLNPKPEPKDPHGHGH
eukprot:TRINITY_DN1014_c0_g1_i1.p1 TRINITY_DN1014_c0_g1~~TRINITY_DN1014_c0_g1_i1.p1  ORF type:complete len:547 (-),score=111.74 TRINITY_DN1014_c0_g1_i1:63-1703(-)